ncbi:uncharacterized protein PRCAT00000681001 [Priceomyces carsonii]|uniref:uncharacterized protein n=1 Tax=Priceomyces carsonii TaxID=28549 RepID=UPI002EDA9C82|nr:unnamed protein product [Priceomyces carsonii]
MSERAVIPLESNPNIFNELGEKLGLSPVLQFCDIYSLTDPDLLGFLPEPVYGVMLLFPLTGDYESHRKQEDSSRPKYNNELFSEIKWVPQTIRNGCGLYALLHILLNIPKDLIVENLILANFSGQLSKAIPQEDIAKLVEGLEHRIQLDENYGVMGQTEAPEAGAHVDFHFISFIKGKNGHLYELDGRRAGPIDLGPCDGESVIKDPKLVQKIQSYMDMADEKNKLKFALMGIAPSLS